MPKGVTWIKDAVTTFDPDNNTVATAAGKTIGYDALVVCPGIQLDWDRIPGVSDTLGKDGVSSNYTYDLAPKTGKLGWELAGAYVGRRIECRELLGLRGVEPTRLRRAEQSDVPRMRACYERLAPTVNGFLDRVDGSWYFAEKKFSEYYTYLFMSERDEVEGYIVYQQAPPEDGAFGFTGQSHEIPVPGGNMSKAVGSRYQVVRPYAMGAGS